MVGFYSGVDIGSSKADVLFLKGKPKRESKGKNDELFNTWLAFEDYYVALDADGIVRQIIFHGDGWEHKGFYSVRIGTEHKAVKAALGAPSKVLQSKEASDPWRRYDYDQLNLSFILSEGQVSSYGIRDFRWVDGQAKKE